MIIICEPQCAGFEHVEVNAALIAALRLAFPQDEMLFLAEPEHLKLVSSRLERLLVDIKYCQIQIPRRDLSDARRLANEFLLCRTVFDFARDNSAGKILFSSIRSSTLISIKVLIRFFDALECVVVPHHILNEISGRPSLVPTQTPFWFRFWLQFGNMKRLRYLVLSPLIEKALSERLPQVTQYVRSIDLPYLFDIEPMQKSLGRDSVRFGIFGVGARSKGTDVFFRIAKAVQGSHVQFAPEFVLVGSVEDRSLEKMLNGSVTVPSVQAPLNREDFENLARSVDYALFLNKPTSYQLTVSGALMDAFSYVTPIIALKQPLVEYYFEAMGDIGYLCESYEEITAVIFDILENKPNERYLTQRHNILKGREKFSPRAISHQLAELWKP